MQRAVVAWCIFFIVRSNAVADDLPGGTPTGSSATENAPMYDERFVTIKDSPASRMRLFDYASIGHADGDENDHYDDEHHEDKTAPPTVSDAEIQAVEKAAALEAENLPYATSPPKVSSADCP